MKIPDRLKPAFWDSELSDQIPFRRLFNFRRIWRNDVLLMTCVALVPLLSLAYFDFHITWRYTENEITLRADRLVSDARRTVQFFLEERQAALQFIAKDNSFEELDDDARLARVLEHLSSSIGGFTDLGVLDDSGRKIRYAGTYALKGMEYADEAWFMEVVSRGTHISDVFLGFRENPHLVIALKQELGDGSFYLLRATLNTEQFNDQLSQIKRSGFGDAFLINHQGVIQTPSLHHGGVLERFPLPVPDYSEQPQVLEVQDLQGNTIIMGYAYIPDSPFILLLIGQKRELMSSWLQTRLVVLAFLLVSIVLILLVILSVATRLVNNIYQADQKRILAMREAEHAGKLASIGRLAAGVAHEINNPLAIINEKAGLMKDIYASGKAHAADAKMIALADSIITAVERCSVITRRLLGFAKHLEVTIQPVDLKEVIEEVLGFLGKEAEFRNISVKVRVAADIPCFESDRGKLEQIFLNLVNNAFAAMGDGGQLCITAERKDTAHILVTVADTGHGITEVDAKRIFEPFFSTRTKSGGTGLGLSITYGLIQELGGTVQVESIVGKGTAFFITLPMAAGNRNG